MMRNTPAVATTFMSLLLATTACPGETGSASGTAAEGGDSSTSESGGDPTTTTDPTDATTTTSTDPTTVDTSVGTDASSSEESGCTGECEIDDDCLPGQMCISCVCIGQATGCEEYGPGAFDNCVAPDAPACPEMGICLTGGPDIGACTYACTEPCDCPAPPPGFEDALLCEEVTGDAESECIIGCGPAEECPEGMFCFQGVACLFGEEPSGIPPYGDCVNLDGACEMATCVTDPDVTLGWCAAACASADDDASCPPAPKGEATPDCIDISGMGDFFCALNCDMGECPMGMTCLGGGLPICVWEPMEEPPPPAPGYGDCANNPDAVCNMEETCLEDASGAVCTEGGCTMASDCAAAPATGDAPVTCGDLGGGDTCYLDCAGGQTCPDGMECVGMSYCHWAAGGFLLDEDFEEGTFVNGWTLADVDGNTPAMQVAFIDAAWIVANNFDGDMNFAAYSTSWYAPADAADDWLITPQFTPSATSQLAWDARAQDPDFPDGYEVRVSTMTADTDDFMIEPALFSIAAEADAYANHSVDLSAYAGMPIFVAFRNNSNDQFVLIVDNVRVTE